MAYKCLFMDRGVYTAQDVNDAISNIVSGGVSGYPFGTNAMNDLNEAVSELTGSGVGYRGTSCLVVNDGGTYKISEGACIMNDGSQIIFDSYGYEITHEADKYEYVYLERDVLHNGINIVVSQEAGGQDTIPLAEIKANGAVLDRRRFASAKIALSAEAKNISITKRVQVSSLNYSNTYAEYDLGFNGWKYIVYRLDGYPREPYILELNDGETTEYFPTANAVNSHNYYVSVTRNGSILEFRYTNSGGSARNYNVEIELR